MIRYILILVFLTIVPAMAQLSNPQKQFIQHENLITVNPGGENSIAGWSETGGGSLTTTTSAALVGAGNASIIFNATAINDVVETAAYTIKAGLFGRECLGRMIYKGGDENLTFQVTDGTSVIQSVVLVNAGTYREANLSFTCPLSGTLNLEVMTSNAADPPAILIDNAYIGENYLRVTNTSGGITGIEAAKLNCDSGSAITSQLGAWVSAIGNVSAGVCAVTLTTGIFSVAPYCWVNDITEDQAVTLTVSSATAVSVQCRTNAAADCTVHDFDLFCLGVK